MDEIINAYTDGALDATSGEKGLAEFSEALLADARTSINSGNVISVPIADLATLGTGVASLIPDLNTITQTTTFATEGLYRIANMAAGDALIDPTKKGIQYAYLKSGVHAQLAEAGPLTATTETAAAINPATLMMAAALYSIEKQLKEIAETQKQILAFLDIEKEARIEADVKSLTEIVTTYKYKWDNELAVTGSYNQVLAIRDRARQNMISYQKKVAGVVSSRQLVVVQNKTNAALSDLEKKFKYYRLSLYTFSLASLMEIMLSGNYKEEYVAEKRDEIQSLSMAYREHFERGSLYLERLGYSGLEKNVVKGIGTAGRAVGRLIGNIPVVKEGPVDEFLQDKGAKLQRNAGKMERRAVREFASVSDPGTGVFVKKMDDVIQIYNHTSQICADNERIYLIA